MKYKDRLTIIKGFEDWAFAGDKDYSLIALLEYLEEKGMLNTSITK